MAPAVKEKWADPAFTAEGKARAAVAPMRLDTLWFNTGTLCNIQCRNCYIESSPKNDRLVYLQAAEVAVYLDEIRDEGLETREIAFTGGEPFLNPELPEMLELCLSRGFSVLVLTNAMRPMMNKRAALLALREKFPGKLSLRVSLDHHSAGAHDAERGKGSFDKALEGLRWLAGNRFPITVAGRSFDGGDPAAGYRNLFARLGLGLDPARDLVVFPEMGVDEDDLPEITTECWGILGKNPASVMCATSRMVVKRKGAASPEVASCTLLPYDERFLLGRTLREALRPVSLQHPYCASFCVLGGASCSG